MFWLFQERSNAQSRAQPVQQQRPAAGMKHQRKSFTNLIMRICFEIPRTCACKFVLLRSFHSLHLFNFELLRHNSEEPTMSQLHLVARRFPTHTEGTHAGRPSGSKYGTRQLVPWFSQVKEEPR